MIKRTISDLIKKLLFMRKAVIIYGPRQSGKTTLVRMLIEELGTSFIELNGDHADSKQMLENPDPVKLKSVAAGAKIVFIDEAQKIPEIATAIKIFVDSHPDLQVIATGSSSFQLMRNTSESLAGRKFEFNLFPLSFEELVAHSNLIEERWHLNNRLIYGSHPEIVTRPELAERILRDLSGSFLFRDILAVDNIRNSAMIEKLVSALALQTGSEVSSTELAELTGLDRGTVDKYLRILEQSLIIFKLQAYSGNKRNEIKKRKKYYFYDNGILNAVTGNFLPVTARGDAGRLWENYLISERRKYLMAREIFINQFFWRTKQQQEIDYIEETRGTFSAYQFKWNVKSKSAFPETFIKNYDVKSAEVINPGNYHGFLWPEKFKED